MKTKNNKKSKHLKRSFIPNLATVFNMFLGFFAITLILNGEPIKAGWVMMVAILFDVIDGKLARETMRDAYKELPQSIDGSIRFSLGWFEHFNNKVFAQLSVPAQFLAKSHARTFLLTC